MSDSPTIDTPTIETPNLDRAESPPTPEGGGSFVDTLEPRKVELTDAEIRQMDSRIERVIDDVYHGRPERSATRPVDPKDLAEHHADELQGRHLDKDGHWRQVMEFYGFTWFEPEQLDKTVGLQKVIPSTLNGLAGEKIWDRYGRPIPNSRLYWAQNHVEGQWRSDRGARLERCPSALRGLAFTMKDLVSNFATPQAFDEWAKHVVKRKARQRQERIDRHKAGRR